MTTLAFDARLAAFILVVFFVVSAVPVPAADTRELAAAVEAARDADLRADWEALLAARDRVAAARESAEPGLVAYYLGYIDWRLSSLVYLVSGPPAMTTVLERAVTELRASIAAQPSFGEAHAMLATCAGMLVNLDRSRVPTLAPTIGEAWAAALAQGAANPRVQLLRAMNEVFVPPQYGGNRERGLERWREAIQLFEQEASSGRVSIRNWGHAEAWAWLGGAYLSMSRPADARIALEEALKLRPDFWWATTALAQARRPLEK